MTSPSGAEVTSVFGLLTILERVKIPLTPFGKGGIGYVLKLIIKKAY